MDSSLTVNAPAIHEGSQIVIGACELQDAALLVTQPEFAPQNTSTKSSRLSHSRKRKQAGSILCDKRTCPDNTLVSEAQPRDTATDFIKTVGAGEGTNSWSAALARVLEANGDAIVPDTTTVLTSSLDPHTSAVVNLPQVVGADVEPSVIFEQSLPANQDHFNELLLSLIAQVKRQNEVIAALISKFTDQEALLRSQTEGIAAIISKSTDQEALLGSQTEGIAALITRTTVQEALTRLIFEALQKMSEEQNLMNRKLIDRLENIEKNMREKALQLREMINTINQIHKHIFQHEVIKPAPVMVELSSPQIREMQNEMIQIFETNLLQTGYGGENSADDSNSPDTLTGLSQSDVDILVRDGGTEGV
ncbi:uncharacterized protein [Misgurnus anguillicaudatus]|uniref:uncharacterized protein isoform X2 n=1 Tax=Misgurnus anguillicaudatus TaxID=75329 RepID=UPI003CCFCD8A